MSQFVIEVLGIDDEDEPECYVVGPFDSTEAALEYAKKHDWDHDENIEDYHVFQLRSPGE